MFAAPSAGATAPSPADIGTSSSASRVSGAVHRGHIIASGTSTPRSSSPAAGSRAAAAASASASGSAASGVGGRGNSNSGNSVLAGYLTSLRDIMVCNIPHAAKVSLGVSVFYATCSVSLSMVRTLPRHL